MQQTFGYTLPKAMHPEFGALVKAECDRIGRELSAQELFDVFRRSYLEAPKVYELAHGSVFEEEAGGQVRFRGSIIVEGTPHPVEAEGNGPIDAFFRALEQVGVQDYHFLSYHEHAFPPVRFQGHRLYRAAEAGRRQGLWRGHRQQHQ